MNRVVGRKEPRLFLIRSFHFLICKTRLSLQKIKERWEKEIKI